MRKLFKKVAIIIAAAALAASLGITASAAPVETSATEVTTTAVTTENTTTAASSVKMSATTTTVPPIEATATTTATFETMYIPVTDSNISDEIDLSSVTINGFKVNISDIALSDMLSTTGMKQFPAGSTVIHVDHYNFNSGMFGIQSNVEDILSFDGTKVSIEVVDENDRVVPTAELDPAKFDTYKVVGVRSSDFFTSNDFEVLYYGGIKTGMKEADLVDILGEGIVINDDIVYKNEKNTMIIQLSEGVIEDITLLNNVTVYPPLDETVKEPLESPYEDGMLADDDLYNYVLDYLDEGVNLDTQGSGVLIGEDVINEESSEADETQKFTSGEKIMYSIAARDGSIFYIIIDKGANGENVYFLNSVDIVDLASLINKDDENLSTQEKNIINGANAVTGSNNYTENAQDEANNGNNTNKNNSSSNNSGATTTAAKKNNNNTLYIVLGIGAVIAIGIGWYFKVGPGKKKNVGFDEEEEDENEEEEYYVEETDEVDDEAPAEEAYDEEDNM